jgi:hypothetical protein
MKVAISIVVSDSSWATFSVAARSVFTSASGCPLAGQRAGVQYIARGATTHALNALITIHWEARRRFGPRKSRKSAKAMKALRTFLPFDFVFQTTIHLQAVYAAERGH